MQAYYSRSANVLVLLKWIGVVVLAAFAWLVGKYTAEYFRPYKK